MTHFVNSTGNEFFTRAAFSEDEDASIGGGNARYLVANFCQGRTLSQHFVASFNLLLEVAIFLGEFPGLESTRNRQ